MGKMSVYEKVSLSKTSKKQKGNQGKFFFMNFRLKDG